MPRRNDFPPHQTRIMNKLYFGLPLALVLAFGVYFFYSYVPAQRAIDRVEAQKKLDAEKARKIAEHERQLKTQAALIADSERRKAERIAREEEEKRMKEQRERLRERYEKANGDIQSFERDVRRLQADIEEEQKFVDRAKDEQASLQKEKEFLVREYVPMAESNAKRLQTLLEQINKVEEEKAKQAALAASGKGGSNSN